MPDEVDLSLLWFVPKNSPLRDRREGESDGLLVTDSRERLRYSQERQKEPIAIRIGPYGDFRPKLRSPDPGCPAYQAGKVGEKAVDVAIGGASNRSCYLRCRFNLN